MYLDKIYHGCRTSGKTHVKCFFILRGRNFSLNILRNKEVCHNFYPAYYDTNVVITGTLKVRSNTCQDDLFTPAYWWRLRRKRCFKAPRINRLVHHSLFYYVELYFVLKWIESKFTDYTTWAETKATKALQNGFVDVSWEN